MTNVVAANLRAAETDGVAGEVFNIAHGRRVTVNQTLARIADIAGKSVTAEYRPSRPGDIQHSQSDTSRARNQLGWQPAVDFSEGLRRTVDWYAENLS